MGHPVYKERTLIFYLSTMSFLVIDFTYLERRVGDIVVKGLAAVDTQRTRSLPVFNISYGSEKVAIFNTR